MNAEQIEEWFYMKDLEPPRLAGEKTCRNKIHEEIRKLVQDLNLKNEEKIKP